jgi:hypothetical protein
MPFTNERIEGKSQLLERLDRNERIDRKTQLLERLDPEREFELEGTFTNHVANAIRASSPRELQQEIDNPSCPLKALNRESQKEADDLQLEALRRNRMDLPRK